MSNLYRYKKNDFRNFPTKNKKFYKVYITLLSFCFPFVTILNLSLSRCLKMAGLAARAPRRGAIKLPLTRELAKIGSSKPIFD